jgi:porin
MSRGKFADHRWLVGIIAAGLCQVNSALLCAREPTMVYAEAETVEQAAPAPMAMEVYAEECVPEAEVEPIDEGLICDYLLFPKGSPFQADVVYTNDTFNNSRGGIKSGTASHGLVDVVLRTNLDALEWSPIGGTFLLHGQNSHGPFLNDFVGSTQSTNINAHPFTRMAEYYWERNFDDGLAIVRVGRQVGAIQFSVLDLAADFTYGAFQKSPNNPLPWYPNPTAAATMDLALTETLHLNMGTFAGGPPSQLTSWGWSQNGQVYSIVQLKNSYSFDGLPGDIQGGSWYDSGSHRAIDNSRDYTGNYGHYCGWDQMMWMEGEQAENQGLGLFAIYSFAPQNRNNVQNHFGGGIVYRGLLPGRDTDVLGCGYTVADFSNSRVGYETEKLVELFYKINITQTMILQPSIQQITAPGGTHGDALLAGFRFGCEL